MKGKRKMKKTFNSILTVLLSILLLLSLVSCNETVEKTGLWEIATYTSDTTLGNGEKTVTVEVVAEGQSITITIKTDKDNLGAALYEHGIVNDPSFFDVCNGMLASWEKDQAWWAFKSGGEMLNYGIDVAEINGGESFSIEYTK